MMQLRLFAPYILQDIEVCQEVALGKLVDKEADAPLLVWLCRWFFNYFDFEKLATSCGLTK